MATKLVPNTNMDIKLHVLCVQKFIAGSKYKLPHSTRTEQTVYSCCSKHNWFNIAQTSIIYKIL